MRAIHAIASILACAAACSSYGTDDETPVPDRDRDAGNDATSDMTDAASDGGGTSDAAVDAFARCDRAKPFGGPTAVPGLTSTSVEGWARMTNDELTVFFQRFDTNFDLWTATRSAIDQPFVGAVKLAGINLSPNADFEPAVNADGTQLFFAADRNSSQLDIWTAKRASRSVAFETPSKVTEVSGQEIDRSPYVAPDGKSLWFESTRSGNTRIYRANLSPVGIGTPELVPLEPEDDTISDAAPAISSDGLALYFASKGRGGPSDYAVYMATRANATAAFGAPMQVVNWTGFAAPSFISPDECRLYVTFGGQSSERTIFMVKR